MSRPRVSNVEAVLVFKGSVDNRLEVSRGGLIMNSSGDVFENITSSTIVNKSTVERSFNKVKEEFDPAVANALKVIAEEIEKSGNKEAAENFDSFNEELQKPEPKKSVLRALWGGITAALPSILQMTDLVTNISKLFGA